MLTFAVSGVMHACGYEMHGSFAATHHGHAKCIIREGEPHWSTMPKWSAAFGKSFMIRPALTPSSTTETARRS